MGYVDRDLIQGEQIVHRAPLHWKVLIVPLILTVVFLILAFIAFRESLGQTDSASSFQIGALIFLVLAAIPIVKGWIKRRSSEFAVTNKRVILKTGVVHNKTAEMFLSKIESVGVDQTVLGRIFGYGSIELRGTGGSLEPFSNVSKPLEFRRQIQEQIGRSLDDRTRGKDSPV